jgi:hypothetical protein
VSAEIEKRWKAGHRHPRLPSEQNQMAKSHSLLVVVVLFVVKPLYFAHFQRAIVFVQSGVDLNVMPLMFPDRFRVLHPVTSFVAVIFHYVIIPVFSDVAFHGRLSDAVRGCLLIVPILILILGYGAGSANHCQS